MHFMTIFCSKFAFYLSNLFKQSNITLKLSMGPEGNLILEQLLISEPDYNMLWLYSRQCLDSREVII